MKKLTQISLIAILLLLITGCSPTVMLNNEQLDPSLPKLNDVKAIPNNTSVAFEWKSLATKGITSLNIYRTDTNEYVNSQTKQLKKIGNIANRFATHYVDTGLKQGSAYTYTFTTVKNGFESAHGEVINIKTLAEFNPITFFQGFQLHMQLCPRQLNVSVPTRQLESIVVASFILPVLYANHIAAHLASRRFDQPIVLVLKFRIAGFQDLKCFKIFF